MTLSNAPQGDEPTVMVTIPVSKECELKKKFSNVMELHKAFPKLTLVQFEPSTTNELKNLKSITVAGFASEAEKFAMMCKD